MSGLTVVVQGSVNADTIPHFERIAEVAEVRSARDLSELEAALPGADILLGWDFRAEELERAWHKADALRWIHWSGAGVDAVLFPELVGSEIVLTNARGIFDRAMAEYVLGALLAMTKKFPETVRLQGRSEWRHRLTERIQDRRVVVIGVGSIGRAIARILGATGMRVTGVGRSRQSPDSDFESIYGVDQLETALAQVEFLVCVLPETTETRGLIDASALAAMPAGARLINVGRGSAVSESALLEALERGHIAEAVLDVFVEEPLPTSSPLWSLPNVLVSPHMSGDYEGYEDDLGRLFADNFARFCRGEPLLNQVHKRRGY